ncbi:MAG: cytochrome c oxidase subunit II [Actinomycetes bacterium]
MPQTPQGAPAKSRLRRLAVALALPIAGISLSGCTLPGFGAHQADTTTGQSAYRLWQGFSVVAAIIGAFVLALIVYAVVAYRRKGDTIPKQTQYHVPLEIIYTVIPILIVIALFVATIVTENKVLAMPKTDVSINVNAFQWGWGFTYDKQNAIAIGNTTESPVMVMPVDTDVKIVLTATDVVHGFYVRDFNFSRFALPGVKNQFTLHATKTGTFFGQCTQLCGLYHSIMYYKVKVVTQAEYQTWLSSFNTPEGKATADAAKKVLKEQMSAHVPVKTEISRGAN